MEIEAEKNIFSCKTYKISSKKNDRNFCKVNTFNKTLNSFFQLVLLNIFGWQTKRHMFNSLVSYKLIQYFEYINIFFFGYAHFSHRYSFFFEMNASRYLN